VFAKIIHLYPEQQLRSYRHCCNN